MAASKSNISHRMALLMEISHLYKIRHSLEGFRHSFIENA